MKKARRAAEQGQRQEARDLCLRMVDVEPGSAVAWKLLSEVVDDPGERLAALEKVVELDRSDAGAQASLASISPKAAARDLPAVSGPGVSPPELFARAKRAYAAGQRRAALYFLYRCTLIDPGYREAWLVVSRLAPRVEDQVEALEKLAALSPQDARLHGRLAQRRQLLQQPLKLAKHYEEQGDLENAIARLKEAVLMGASPGERLEAQRRLESAQLRAGLPVFHKPAPWLTVGRLAAGPVLLYLAMALTHSGLNPLQLSPFTLLGAGLVTGGSLLVVVTRLHPDQNLPSGIFVRHRQNSGLSRLELWLLGLLLVLGPFTLLVIDSLFRG